MNINRTAITRIAQKHHLRLLVLFGSQATGKTHPKSDIDFAFYALHPVNEQQLYDDLAALFKREDIDVLNLVTTHNHYLRFKILHTGKVVYEEKYGVYDRMKGESYFDYIDFRKYYDLHDKLLSQRIAGMSI